VVVKECLLGEESVFWERLHWTTKYCNVYILMFFFASFLGYFVCLPISMLLFLSFFPHFFLCVSFIPFLFIFLSL